MILKSIPKYRKSVINWYTIVYTTLLNGCLLRKETLLRYTQEVAGSNPASPTSDINIVLLTRKERLLR